MVTLGGERGLLPPCRFSPPKFRPSLRILWASVTYGCFRASQGVHRVQGLQQLSPPSMPSIGRFRSLDPQEPMGCRYSSLCLPLVS